MKRMMAVLILAAVFALTGCIDYTEELTLNADGSGSVKMHIVMDKAFLRDMEQLSGEYGDSTEEDNEEICSEEEMRAALAAMNSGIELVEYTKDESEESLEYRFEFKFSDYADFADLQYACGEPDQSTSETGFEFTYEQQPNGSWLFRRFTDGAEEVDYGSSGPDDQMMADAKPLPNDEYSGDEEVVDPDQVDMDKLGEAMKELGEAMQGMATPETEGEDYDESAGMDFNSMMEGMAASMRRAQEDMKNHKLTYIVHLPGAVSESNATDVSGNTAKWEYTLDQADKKPSVLEASVKP